MKLIGSVRFPLLAALALLPSMVAHADSGTTSYSSAGKYSLVPYGTGGGLRLPQKEQRGPYGWSDYFSAKATTGFTAEEVVPSSLGYSDTAMRVQGIGSWPMTESFSLTGRLGVVRQDYEHRWSPLLTAPGMERGTDLTFGIGLKYRPSKNFDLRLGYDRFDGMRLDGPRQSDADMFSLGVEARF